MQKHIKFPEAYLNISHMYVYTLPKTEMKVKG